MKNTLKKGLATLLTGAALALGTGCAIKQVESTVDYEFRFEDGTQNWKAHGYHNSPQELISIFLSKRPYQSVDDNGCDVYTDRAKRRAFAKNLDDNPDSTIANMGVNDFKYIDCNEPGLSEGDSYSFTLNILEGENPDYFRTVNITEVMEEGGRIETRISAIEGDRNPEGKWWKEDLDQGEPVEEPPVEFYDDFKLMAYFAFQKGISVE